MQRYCTVCTFSDLTWRYDFKHDDHFTFNEASFSFECQTTLCNEEFYRKTFKLVIVNTCCVKQPLCLYRVRYNGTGNVVFSFSLTPINPIFFVNLTCICEVKM